MPRTEQVPVTHDGDHVKCLRCARENLPELRMRGALAAGELHDADTVFAHRAEQGEQILALAPRQLLGGRRHVAVITAEVARVRDLHAHMQRRVRVKATGHEQGGSTGHGL